MRRLIAAVSAGIVEGNAIVDLNYEEDKAAAVDLNLVATEDGEFVEIQVSGEEATFTQGHLEEMLALGRNAIARLIVAQRNVIDFLA
jgi:ribonuclease PH